MASSFTGKMGIATAVSLGLTGAFALVTGGLSPFFAGASAMFGTATMVSVSASKYDHKPPG